MDALAAFTDRLVGETDQVESRLAGRNLALHLDGARLQAKIGHRPNQCDHEYPLSRGVLAAKTERVEWVNRASRTADLGSERAWSTLLQA
jgi:hypothetical protein